MASEMKKCAHPACTCTVERDTKYCSQYCKDAGATTEVSCSCGHAGCGMSESIPGSGRASGRS